MKRSCALVFLIVTACSDGKADRAAQPTASASPGASPAASAPAPPSAIPPATARKVTQENEFYDFAYSYPASVAAIPGLSASLDADLNRHLARLKHDASAAQDDARLGNIPYHKWSYGQTWQVVTDLPGWLSLSAAFSSYSGGAHGMYWSGAMLWDKRASKARDPLSLFRSNQALAKAIRQPFCAALDKQRGEKRGSPVNRASGNEFDRCIDPTAETVILGSKAHQSFDRIGILVPPYEAGPYAEGEYEVTVPVTPAVLAAVRPEFRAAFSVTQ